MAATVKILIRPNGKVQTEINGVPGQGCVSLLKGLQEQLGVVINSELTAEAGLETEATLTQTASCG